MYLAQPDYVFYHGTRNEDLPENFKAALIAAGRDHLYQDPSWFNVQAVNNQSFSITNTTSELRNGLKGEDALWFSLYIANWLGFDVAYLLGVDMNPGSTHFVEDMEGPAVGSEADRSLGRFERDLWQARNWNEKLALLIYENLDIKVRNCNPDSAVKAFPYFSFQDAWELSKEV
jgi:hypothetical protein